MERIGLCGLPSIFEGVSRGGWSFALRRLSQGIANHEDSQLSDMGKVPVKCLRWALIGRAQARSISTATAL
jgi:hypothetical protein